MLLIFKSAMAFFFLFFLHGISIGNGQQGISYNISLLVIIIIQQRISFYYSQKNHKKMNDDLAQIKQDLETTNQALDNIKIDIEGLDQKIQELGDAPTQAQLDDLKALSAAVASKAKGIDAMTPTVDTPAPVVDGTAMGSTAENNTTPPPSQDDVKEEVVPPVEEVVPPVPERVDKEEL